MAKINAWPDERLYRILLLSNAKVWSIARVGLDEGIRADNFTLIEPLLPRLRQRARQAETAARQIVELHQGTGRPPKWYTIGSAVRLGHLAILDEIKRMSGYCNGHRWPLIELSLEAIAEATAEIERRIMSVPPPEPDIIAEAERVAALAMEAE